jgi:hypothetical protein
MQWHKSLLMVVQQGHLNVPQPLPYPFDYPRPSAGVIRPFKHYNVGPIEYPAFNITTSKVTAFNVTASDVTIGAYIDGPS